MITRTAFCSTVFAAIYLSGPIRAQSVQSDIGFSSPQVALQSLRARGADIEFSEQAGWTVALDKANKTVWLFAHQGDPAYPTVVKRAPTQTAKGWVIGSRIMCGGTQVACDKVVASFAN